VAEVAAATDGFRHAVLVYRGFAEYRGALTRFVRDGLARSEPVLLAMPRARLGLQDWTQDSPGVTAADISELGRNPARMIPALRAFADRHLGRRVRIVSESVWPGRPPGEVRESIRHEALVDRAMADVQATMICPYSAGGLQESVLADAGCTHQWQLGAAGLLPAEAYGGPGAAPAAALVSLPPPPADAETVEYRASLRPVRAMVTTVGERAGLPSSQLTDLIIAASEVAANTLRHTGSGGIARAWQCGGEVICQLADTGFIADPLAGLRHPSLDEAGGHGLWLVNQVCDLVEIRTGSRGTVVRLHMRLPGRD
jgi:anti-sigma regulatory factor (Ser/Thr protein kinase)